MHDRAPCNPRNALPICPTCNRHKPWIPHLPESRPNTVCIDATVTARNGVCGMHEARTVAVHWTERAVA